jgi:GT2 family glycosyltransferase
MQDLSIIIINYNTSQYTIKCIESILRLTSAEINYSIILIDNCSVTADVEILESYLIKSNEPKIYFHKNQINSGFGGGNMMGTQFADSKYYAFVNNDSVLLNDCFTIMIKQMELNLEYGICGPETYNENNKLLPTLDHFASPAKLFFGRKILEKINPVKYPNRKKKYEKPQRGQFISGSFMLVRAADFWKVGGFDTNIFLYFEETDLCKRLQKIGKFAYLIPEAKFIHYHGVSTPKSIAIKTELKLSLLYVIKKHYGYIWHKIILNKLRFQFLLKSIAKPEYLPIFNVLVKGGSLSYSLKYKQTENK